MSWNRTYRPQKVAHLHLTTVRQQLQRLLEDGRIPQTMLFAGPKGTGKTSTSRILGAVLNDPVNTAAVETVFFGEDATKNPTFKDVTSSEPLITSILNGTSYVVQEMDAASNRGIDDVRQLKERIMLPPQEGIMTVYILDEAHMLTTEAFNALLKLLEEPPSHVLFILATTELHKIPATIVSRCQVIQFRKATDAELQASLEGVLKAEKISAEDDAIQALLQKADGSFRDVIKLAELAVHDKKIELSHVQTSIFGNLDSELEQLLTNITQKDSAAVLLQFEQFRSQQVEPAFLHKRLLERLHHSLLVSNKLAEGSELVSVQVAQYLLQHLSDPSLSQANPLPHLPLELRMLSIIEKAQKKGLHSSSKSSSKPAPNKSKVVSATIVQPKKVSATLTTKNDSSKNQPNLAEQWTEFIEYVKELSAPVAVLLQSTKLVMAEANSATIAVYYSFHYEQLTQTATQNILSSAIEQFIGSDYHLSFQLADAQTRSPLTRKVAAQALL